MFKYSLSLLLLGGKWNFTQMSFNMDNVCVVQPRLGVPLWQFI